LPDVSRRSFLHAAAGGAALLALPGCASSRAAGPRPPVASPGSRDGGCRFLVVGDTQRSAANEPLNDRARTAIYDRLREALADPGLFVLHVGDVVDIGGDPADWRDDFDAPFWEQLNEAQRARVFPAPGNHDYKTHILDYGGSLDRYRAHFPHLHGRRYYRFTCGRSAFVVFDSGRNGLLGKLFGERWRNGVEEQMRWLHGRVLPDLAAQARTGEVDQLFLVVHKPARPTPILLRNRQTGRVLADIDRWNSDNGLGLRITSLHGHIHTFSHQNLGGVEQIITGGGGGPQRGSHYFGHVERPEDLDLYRAEKLAVAGDDPGLFDRLRHDDTHFGYLDVTVPPAGAATITYQRFDDETGGFHADYELQR
jgi:hypothetical protein